MRSARARRSACRAELGPMARRRNGRSEDRRIRTACARSHAASPGNHAGALIMAYDLFTPILNARTRAPHFFNGRLLTGEAMTDEHRAQTVARELLAQSVGEGVAWGLEVEQVATSPIERPSVRVKSGVAINRCGEILLLANDVEVQLVRPAEEVPTPDKVFQTCI